MSRGIGRRTRVRIPASPLEAKAGLSHALGPAFVVPANERHFPSRPPQTISPRAALAGAESRLALNIGNGPARLSTDTTFRDQSCEPRECHPERAAAAHPRKHGISA